VGESEEGVSAAREGEGERRGREKGRTDRELELALAAADRQERDLGAAAHGLEQLAKALGRARAGLVDAHDERDAAELAQLAVEVALADLEQVARGDAVVAVRVVSRGRDEDDVLGRAGGGAQEVVAEARVAAAGGSCTGSGLALRRRGESERERDAPAAPNDDDASSRAALAAVRRADRARLAHAAQRLALVVRLALGVPLDAVPHGEDARAIDGDDALLEERDRLDDVARRHAVRRAVLAEALVRDRRCGQERAQSSV